MISPLPPQYYVMFILRVSAFKSDCMLCHQTICMLWIDLYLILSNLISIKTYSNQVTLYIKLQNIFSLVPFGVLGGQ